MAHLRSHVVGAGKARKATRGATEEHADEKAARETQAKLVTAAEKAGRRRREPRGGFAAKPDASTLATLPKAKR